MTDQELREKIAALLIEPDIGLCDWEIGKWQLQNWKSSLPDLILALIKEAGYKKPRLEVIGELDPVQVTIGGFLMPDQLPEWAKANGYILKIDANAQIEYWDSQFDKFARNRGYVKLSKDQSTPHEPDFYDDWGGESGRAGYKHGQQDMLKAGWCKVEAKE